MREKSNAERVSIGCALLIWKPIVSLILGVIVFLGFLLLLLTSTIPDKLADAQFYSDIISGEDTYNRIYDEVLVDPELESTARDLLGDFQAANQAETVELLRQIIPPAYLQSQVDDSIQRAVDYFNEDSESLELHVELGQLIDGIKPALFRYIDQRIDGLAEEDLGQLECTPQGVREAANRYQERWGQLAAGVVPESVPSLSSFDHSCRQAIFQVAFDLAVRSGALDERAKQGLLAQGPQIEQAFVDGDTHRVLKLAARPIATPSMDDAILRIREELDEGDRLDLMHRAATWNDSITEAKLRSGLDSIRDGVGRGRKLGKGVALAMLIGGSILLGLVHFPSLKNGLRWPGLTLLLTGVVSFVGTKGLESQLPDRLRSLVELDAGSALGAPPSVSELGGDLAVSFGDRLIDGLASVALIVLIVGAVMFVASFFTGYVISRYKLR